MSNIGHHSMVVDDDLAVPGDCCKVPAKAAKVETRAGSFGETPAQEFGSAFFTAQGQKPAAWIVRARAWLPAAC
jgi:hypothetical protein